MLIMKKILSVVGITGGTFFLLVAAICVEEWFSDPAYAADMEISGLIMCIVLGIFGVTLSVLGIQTLRLQKLYREYKEIAEASQDGFIPDMAAILSQPEDKVRRNLEKLCKKRRFYGTFETFFRNCGIFYIDDSYNCYFDNEFVYGNKKKCKGRDFLRHERFRGFCVE